MINKNVALEHEWALFYRLTNGRKLKNNNAEEHKRTILRGYQIIHSIVARTYK